MTTASPFMLDVEAISDTELRMTRSFAAPRERVFRAFIDPALIPRWWGRNGSTTTVDQFDYRPGGTWRFVQHSNDGSEHAFRGELIEVEPPARLAQTFEYEGAPGQVLTERTELTEVDGVTTVTTISTFPSRAALDAMLGVGMADGAAETYDRLEAALDEIAAEDDESATIVLRRFYDAPRELIVRAWTDDRHLDRWWGPEGFSTVTEAIDARSGGTWRYTMTGPDGVIYPNFTWYDQVSPERIVYRHGAGPDDEANAFHVTVTFTDHGGTTELCAEMRFPTVDACRAVRAFGAIERGYETHAKLAAYLPTMA